MSTKKPVPGKLSFQSDKEIKTLLGEQKQRKFITSRAVLKEMLKGPAG